MEVTLDQIVNSQEPQPRVIKVRKAYHSSEKQDWQTNDDVLSLIRAVGPIVLDPATHESNPTDAELFICKGDQPDGLTADWGAIRKAHGLINGLTYLNPEYDTDRIGLWTDQLCDQWFKHGLEQIMLGPSRSDRDWFMQVSESCTLAFNFAVPRLKFKGAKAGAPFPSVIWYWGDNVAKFRESFGRRNGQFWKPV